MQIWYIEVSNLLFLVLSRPIKMASTLWPQKQPFKAKRHAITKDYDVTQKSLGVGINGKVLQCYKKGDRVQKFALKVNIIDFTDL